MPAKAADTSLSLKDGSDPLELDCPPQISIDGDVTLTFKKTTSDQTLSKQRSRLELTRGQEGYTQDGRTDCTMNEVQVQDPTSILAKEGDNLPGQNGYRNERITHSIGSAK